MSTIRYVAKTTQKKCPHTRYGGHFFLCFFADMSCCGHLYMRFLRTYLVAAICFFCADISCSDISVYVFTDIIFFCIVGISCARITLCVFLKTQVLSCSDHFFLCFLRTYIILLRTFIFPFFVDLFCGGYFFYVITDISCCGYFSIWRTQLHVFVFIYLFIY